MVVSPQGESNPGIVSRPIEMYLQERVDWADALTNNGGIGWDTPPNPLELQCFAIRFLAYS